MNKRYTLLVAGLLAIANVAEAGASRNPQSLKSRLSSMLAATRSSSTGNTLLTYGVGGTAWYYISKILADKYNLLSPGYSNLIAYDIGVAGAGELLDGVVPGAGFVSSTASEVGFLYTVFDLYRNELGKKLPAHYHNNDLVKLTYLIVGYKALKIAADYGPGLLYDAAVSLATSVANAISSMSSSCPDCASCPTVQQTAAL